jgi:glycosyltransferase involved in cell wall biosynthesis
MAKLSVLIPSRCERFLQQTVSDVLAKARGDIEVVVNLDGYWPEPPLTDDPRLVVLHQPAQRGMRPGINAAAAVARGEFLMKLDGHCMLDEGFDEILKADCDGDWLIVPRRVSLDAERWAVLNTGKSPVDAHYLSWPYERPGDRTCGLHGNVWNDRQRKRLEVLIDDEMSSQGSCWFTSRGHWQRCLEPMEVHHYGTFAQEFQELGCKTWLSGGRVVVNKRTKYAHLHKGRQYGTGYKFNSARWEQWAQERESARRFTIDWWLRDKWSERVRDFAWLIERFWPVPGWPEDWQKVVAETPEFEAIPLPPSVLC